MARNLIIIIVAIFVLLSACDNSKRRTQSENLTTKTDTTEAIKIGDYWVTPNPLFEFNALNNSSSDTLLIVTCSEYVYSPFGIIKNKSEFNSSMLKNFSVTNRTDTIDDEKNEFNILKLNTSRLIFFFDNDSDASKHSDLFKGEIYDSEVQFVNGVHIGMSKVAFYNLFFENFPNELLGKYKYFVLESCVQGMTHIYSFKGNKLQSVNFRTDSYWTVNY